MDFWNSMDTTQKIVLGVALAVLVIAIIVFFFYKPSSQSSKSQGQMHGQQGQQVTDLTSLSNSPRNDAIVFFYSPSCIHCKNMEPTWNEFEQKYNNYKGIQLLKINASVDMEIIKIHNISGFPTVKYCPNGVNDGSGVVYQGDRSINSLAEFLQQYA